MPEIGGTDVSRNLRRRATALGAAPPPVRTRPVVQPNAGGPRALPYVGAHRGTAPRHRWGLVLAGGAAKGAYQVGAVERLADLGIGVSAIAGTGIGALNGVTVAAAGSPREGATRLVKLWTAFTNRMSAVQAGRPDARDEYLAEHFDRLAPRVGRLLRARGDLEQLADRAIDIEALRAGTTMRVAIHPVPPVLRLPHLKVAREASEWLTAPAGRRSRVLRLNGLGHGEIKEAVLGSAALPFLFGPREVAGAYYRDGMLGRDGTPVRALAELDRCDIVIVVHLGPAEPLGHFAQRNPTLLQLRPSRPLGTADDWLDFSPAAFQRLRAQGYEDTARLLSRTPGLFAPARARLGDRRQAAPWELSPVRATRRCPPGGDDSGPPNP